MTMTSFLFGKKPSIEVDYKSRLERKLYLAREDPEPVFDLSECNLKSVPSGIYSLCKVFRKEKLFLQVNQLSSLAGGGQLSDLSLLVSLDLHDNCLSALPEDIGHLANLQELNVSKNHLRKLPNVFESLVKLKWLNCSHNRLKCLPSSLGQLTYLDLRGNPTLRSLPTSAVKHLLVDKHLQTTDTDVPSSVQLTTHAILVNIGCEPGANNDFQKIPASSKEDKTTLPEESSCQEALMMFEQKKKEKLQELLAVEQTLQEQKDREYKLHLDIKEDKNKLLTSLKEQEKKIEEDIHRCHLKSEKEREKLLNHLLEEERSTEERVNDLLALSQALHASQVWQEQDLWEQQILSHMRDRTTQLRRQEVLDALESLLEEEQARKAKLLFYEKARAEVVQNSLLKGVEWSERVSSVLSSQELRHTSLVSALEADSEVQKALVTTLLEQTDLRTQGLVMQVSMVQQELAALTALECQRRQVSSQHFMNELIVKRKTLSELLVKLMKEQSERRRQLVDALHHLDSESQMERGCDFWLQQCQHLLSVRPQGCKTFLDPGLIHCMVTAGVAHCVPLLSCCQLDNLTASTLAQIGVTNVEEQAVILAVVEAHLRHQDMRPSAPPDEFTPSCPPASRDPLPECIICMELECAIVFVPCGHLCACLPCATQLLLCPLCRANIERKIHVTMP